MFALNGSIGEEICLYPASTFDNCMCAIMSAMQMNGNFKTNRCYRLIRRIALLAFFPLSVALACRAHGAAQVQMPGECTNPDGMCVDAKNRLVIAAPNNDRKQPGAIFRLDGPDQKPYKWFDVPAHPTSGYAAPMGICFGPDGELYVCDNQKDSNGRLLRITFRDDKVATCETVAVGLDNANGVKYLNGRLYLTQAFLYGVKRADGAATSGLYMFNATDRDVRVGNTPDDPQCVFTDVTRNPEIRGGLNGVAVDRDGQIYVSNYGDGRLWRLTVGADGRVATTELLVRGGEGLVTPDGLCADEGCNVYIADMRGNAAMMYALGGRIQCIHRGGFARPSEPCVWRGDLYIANYGGTTLERLPLPNAPHPDMVGARRSITMEAFLRTDPGLKRLGTFRTRTSNEIKASNWCLGCECLDRDFADFAKFGRYIGQTGAKHARIFSGWAKTEKKKGVYDYAWLDVQVRELVAMGVKPWMCLSYGNPLYGSDTNLGAGVAAITDDPEAFAAWLRFCRETVRRYGDVIDAWEVWNEPFGNQMPAYAKLLVATSDAVREVQPKARILASAVGGYPNAEKLLGILREAGRLDAVSKWAIHPYVPNPDAPNNWWGYDTVARFERMLKAANPAYEVVQGEVGCPAQLEFGHALSSRPWTEYSQVKWNLRSMAGSAVLGRPHSIFAIIDFQYFGYMLQSYGLLRADLGKNVIYARPLYHAARNMFSFFDSEVKPVGLADGVAFKVLEARIPQQDLPSCDETDQLPPDAPRKVKVARFEKAGTPVLLAWYSHRIPSDALVFDQIELTVPGVTLSDPVWMDMITGRVFEIPAADIVRKDGVTVFRNLPMWDSPVLLAERAQVERTR